eukprot:88367_1
MPREIIHVSVGQCGNQIGHVFWNRMLEEHNIRQDGYFDMHENLEYEDFFKLDKIEVYFQESEIQDKYVPRSVMFDLEPGVVEKVLNSPIGPLFHPDFILTQASGAGNNWAKGHYTLGAEVIDEAMDIIRKNSEGCDLLQGFQVSHSIGGGTGSGFGTLVMEKLKDYYPDRITETWSIYPTPKVSDVVVEPYNAILTISQLMTDSDATFVTDNEALFDISHNILKQKSPKFADLNWILSLIIGGVTASLRFPGILNCDLRKMSVNLVPFPRLHFFTSSYAPLIHQGDEFKKTDWSLSRLSDNVWDKKHLLTSIAEEDGGKFLSASIMYRGQDVASAQVDDITKKYLNRQHDQFVEWIPNNIKTAIITLKPQKVVKSATLVANITSVKDCFERIWASFNKLFEKKAFFHWYQGEGMHEIEFIDAEAQIKDLIMEYFEKQEVVIDYDNLYNQEYDLHEPSEYEHSEEEEEEEEEPHIQQEQPAKQQHQPHRTKNHLDDDLDEDDRLGDDFDDYNEDEYNEEHYTDEEYNDEEYLDDYDEEYDD